jgi:hypothetical protein
MVAPPVFRALEIPLPQAYPFNTGHNLGRGVAPRIAPVRDRIASAHQPAVQVGVACEAAGKSPSVSVAVERLATDKLRPDRLSQCVCAYLLAGVGRPDLLRIGLLSWQQLSDYGILYRKSSIMGRDAVYPIITFPRYHRKSMIIFMRHLSEGDLTRGSRIRCYGVTMRFEPLSGKFSVASSLKILISIYALIENAE